MRIVDNPSEFRANIVVKLFDIIGDNKITTNLEKGILNYSIDVSNKQNIVKKWDNEFFVIIYTERLRTIMFNLNKNDALLQQIKNKEIKPHKLAFMTHQEMNPEKWTPLIEDKKIRDKNMYNPQIDANTDNFTCGKCKSKRCSYYQLQTRSGDEPMTTFVTCIDCGSRWKC
jgi:transcription elongation factor S-II|tara:strand:- start:3392 stop:3904 length:513 start_codon:yes stop_codon:yes gene_type:complete